MAHDVFLSYRRTDQELARKLVHDMEAVGLSVWWDQRIEGGHDWRDAIADGLVGSQALVILFSEACNESKQLRKELAMADTLDKEIIPVLIEDTMPRGHYLYELAARNWIQIHPSPETKTAELAGRLKRELATGRPVAPRPVASSGPEPVMDAPDSAPVAPPIAADTVEKVTRATRAHKAARRDRRDFLPFKWYEVLIAVLFGGFGWLGAYDVDTGEQLSQSPVLDVVSFFLLALLIIAVLVFPFRYYLRRRRMWRAVRAYSLSILVLAVAIGIAFVVHPDIIDGEIGAVENVVYMLIGSIVVFGLIATVAFSVYGVMHYRRTKRLLDSNTQLI